MRFNDINRGLTENTGTTNAKDVQQVSHVQVSFAEIDYVSTEVPELLVRVTRISSEVHR